jgi:hypothetical protein
MVDFVASLVISVFVSGCGDTAHRGRCHAQLFGDAGGRGWLSRLGKMVDRLEIVFDGTGQVCGHRTVPLQK